VLRTCVDGLFDDEGDANWVGRGFAFTSRDAGTLDKFPPNLDCDLWPTVFPDMRWRLRSFHSQYFISK